ncbi:DsbA family protein [Pelosinus sp. IPA-1]|uniref:DsbA family protein n=1 Tax=Pelosinus sp. IPA-1 TaxID=3029569 RepID=UPI0024361C7B|nr:DsbA family protein [Pelosinus sp. IPA-1]GMA98491.1 DsbA family protein [Pelosinus sp. IPA-1]
MKPQIYYVMDTMCGWCYGFSDVINQAHEKYKSDLDITILPAGMWIGENVKKMNDSLSHFIRTHNITLTKLTGKKFGDGFEKNILQNKVAILDSLPGAKAVVVMQTVKKEKSFEYLKEIQNAFYIHGKDTNDWQLYANIAENFGVSKEIFKKEYFSEQHAKIVNDCFALAEQLGVSTYPSVVAVIEGKAKLISQGYVEWSELEVILDRYI